MGTEEREREREKRVFPEYVVVVSPTVRFIEAPAIRRPPRRNEYYGHRRPDHDVSIKSGKRKQRANNNAENGRLKIDARRTHCCLFLVAILLFKKMHTIFTTASIPPVPQLPNVPRRFRPPPQSATLTRHVLGALQTAFGCIDSRIFSGTRSLIVTVPILAASHTQKCAMRMRRQGVLSLHYGSDTSSPLVFEGMRCDVQCGPLSAIHATGPRR